MKRLMQGEKVIGDYPKDWEPPEESDLFAGLADGSMYYVDLPPEPPPSYAELRRMTYPPIGDQLDALWKGGAEMEAMRASVQAVKKKYPKP